MTNPTLAFDSRRQPVAGMRSGGSSTRRMLFSSASTFVELAVPAASVSAGSGRTVSLHGSVVSQAQMAAGICIVVTAQDGQETAAWTNDHGEFVAEVHSTAAFKVRCEVPGEPALHLSIDDA